MSKRGQLVLFAIGQGVAIAAAITCFALLYLSLLGSPIIVTESNVVLAIVEMGFLILAIGTCFSAFEIYYRSLRFQERSTNGS